MSVGSHDYGRHRCESPCAHASHEFQRATMFNLLHAFPHRSFSYGSDFGDGTFRDEVLRQPLRTRHVRALVADTLERLLAQPYKLLESTYRPGCTNVLHGL